MQFIGEGALGCHMSITRLTSPERTKTIISHSMARLEPKQCDKYAKDGILSFSFLLHSRVSTFLLYASLISLPSHLSPRKPINADIHNHHSCRQAPDERSDTALPACRAIPARRENSALEAAASAQTDGADSLSWVPSRPCASLAS